MNGQRKLSTAHDNKQSFFIIIDASFFTAGAGRSWRENGNRGNGGEDDEGGEENGGGNEGR